MKEMKLGIMQPYFFPYIGYFQLLNAVDEFVVYDNIEYTRKGWINRNRMLCNGKDAFFTIPLQKDSDFLDVRERHISENWKSEKKKILSRIFESYRKAPYIESVFPLVESCFNYEEKNLFGYIYHSIEKISGFLNISTPLVVSSTIEIDHDLRAAEKVIAICHSRRAKQYLNPIGGVKLYNREQFMKEGIELKFIRTGDVVYRQFDNEFVSSLSIMDVLMFNSVEKTGEFMNRAFEIE
jgi:hypothetical protein